MKTKLFLATLTLGLLFATTVQALTLKEIFQRPLPNVVDFVNQIINWAKWLWSKITYYGNLILNWSLDNLIAYLVKVIRWFWQLIKSGFLTGLEMLKNLLKILLGQSGIDWKNIKWPWE